MTKRETDARCVRAREIDLAAFALSPRAPEHAEFLAHYPRCTDCAAEVAAQRAIIAALASGGVAHPAEESLLAYAGARGSLAAAERAEIEAHLPRCASCRSELAVLAAFDPARLAAPRPSPLAAGWRSVLEALRAPRLAPAFAAALLLLVAALVFWRMPREAGEPAVQQAQESPPPAERAAPQPAPAPLPEAPAPAPQLAVEETPPAPAPVELPPVREAPLPEPAPRAGPAAIAEAPPPRETEAAPAPAPPPPLEIAALLPSEMPRYEAGALAAGPALRIGGVARSSQAGTPAPQALAPRQLGWTQRPSPTLYWRIPAATAHAVEVSLSAEDADAPLLEVALPGPHAAGTHAFSLAEHGVRLAPGVAYRWYVAVVPDAARRSNDVVSGGAIRYEPPSGEVAQRLEGAPPGRAAHALAASGYWYDAFDQLSQWLAREPDADVLRRHRAALLEQVGLTPE